MQQLEGKPFNDRKSQ